MSIFNCLPSIPSTNQVCQIVESFDPSNEDKANKDMDDLIDRVPGGYDKARSTSLEGRTEFVFTRIRHIIKNLPYFGAGFPMYEAMKDCLDLDLDNESVLAHIWGKLLERVFFNEDFKKNGREEFLTWMRSNPLNSLKLITNLQTLIYIRRLQEIVDERKRNTTTQPCCERDEPGCSSESDSSSETEEDDIVIDDNNDDGVECCP